MISSLLRVSLFLFVAVPATADAGGAVQKIIPPAPLIIIPRKTHKSPISSYFLNKQFNSVNTIPSYPKPTKNRYEIIYAQMHRYI